MVATGLSTFICLVAIILLSKRCGMQTDLGTWIVFFAPLALASTPMVAVGVLLILTAACVKTDLVLCSKERQEIRHECLQLISKVQPYFSRSDRRIART